MPSKLNRKIVFEQVSDDGRMIFKFYDTGSLNVIDGLEPIVKRTGNPNSFLRVNNLVEPEDVKLLPALIELISEVASVDSNFSLEVFRRALGDTLDRIVLDPKLDSRMKFAMFAGATSDTFCVTYDTIKDAAFANEDRLDFAYDIRSLRYFLRPDLGVTSMDFDKRAKSEEEFLERQAVIAARSSEEFFKLSQERVYGGLVTGHIANQCRRVDMASAARYSLTGIYGNMLLSPDENKELASSMVKNSRMNGSYSAGIQRLLSYSWLTMGETRTAEALHFIHKFTQLDPYDYNYHGFSIEKLAFDLGEITEEVLFRALKNDDLPFEIAVSVEV